MSSTGLPAASNREAQLTKWAKDILSASQFEPLPNDASLRKYYRCTVDGKRTIAMDAPPPESIERFESVAHLFGQAGLRVPKIYAASKSEGFCLLEDFGDNLLSSDGPSNRQAYERACATLVHLQKKVDAAKLPPFDREFIMRELSFFPQWYCADFRGKPLTDAEQQSYQQVCDFLADALLAQPQAAMHRDFHSRNLFDIEPGPGIIDFQDAVRGPHAYDIASLLRDLYVDMEPEEELDFLARHFENVRNAGLPVADDYAEYYLAFEYASLQRLTKILGLFVRLHRERNKDFYLRYLPRCAQQAHAIALRYRSLRPLAVMIEARS